MYSLDDCQILTQTAEEPIVAEKLYKAALVGDVKVGLGSLMFRILFDEPKGSIGMDFCTIPFKLGVKIIKVQFWRGSLEFRADSKLPGSFFKGLRAVVLVYDITKKSTFDKLEGLIATAKEEGITKFFLLGNMKDEEANREVSITEANEYVMKHEISYFAEVSAKTGEELKKAFLTIANNIVSSDDTGEE